MGISKVGLKTSFVKWLRTGITVPFPAMSLRFVSVPDILTIVEFVMLLAIGLGTDIWLEVPIDMSPAKDSQLCGRRTQVGVL